MTSEFNLLFIQNLTEDMLFIHPTTAAAAATSLQSCLTLCDPIDGSPPGSPAPGILQARTLEWVAISFSNAWKWKWKVAQSCLTLSDPMDCSPPGSSIHGIFQARVLEWGAIAFSISNNYWVLFREVGVRQQWKSKTGEKKKPANQPNTKTLTRTTTKLLSWWWKSTHFINTAGSTIQWQTVGKGHSDGNAASEGCEEEPRVESGESTPRQGHGRQERVWNTQDGITRQHGWSRASTGEQVMETRAKGRPVAELCSPSSAPGRAADGYNTGPCPPGNPQPGGGKNQHIAGWWMPSPRQEWGVLGAQCLAPHPGLVFWQRRAKSLEGWGGRGPAEAADAQEEAAARSQKDVCNLWTNKMVVMMAWAPYYRFLGKVLPHLKTVHNTYQAVVRIHVADKWSI